MRLVADTNIILSALIKDGVTRKIILNQGLELFVPAFSLSEIQKYKEYVCKKSSMTKEDFDILLEIIFRKIKIISSEFYKDHLNYAETLIDDIKDVPFLACAFALNLEIWSDDKHFKQQNEIRIFTTKDMLYYLLQIFYP